MMNIELVFRLGGISAILLSAVWLAFTLSNRFGLYRRGKNRPETPASPREIPFTDKDANGELERRFKKDRAGKIIHSGLIMGFVLSIPAHVFSVAGRIAGSDALAYTALGLFALSSAFCGTAAGFAAVRRLVSGKNGPAGSPFTIIPLVSIISIAATGFMYSGAMMDAAEATAAAASGTDYYLLVSRFMHVISIAVFIILIARTNLLHMVLSIVRKRSGIPAITGRLKDTEQTVNALLISQKESSQSLPVTVQDSFGLKNAADLSREQMMQIDNCVSCGLCNRNCPASLSGKNLSPQKMINIQRRLLDKMQSNGKEKTDKDLPGDFEDKNIITMAEECSMCHACESSCPVAVTHVDKIADIRRARVLGVGKAPAAWAKALVSCERTGNISGQQEADRKDFRDELKIPELSQGRDVSCVLWIGCHAYSDPRMKNVIASFLLLLKRAGLTFAAIAAEKCCGDMPRRIGDEYLFQTLAYQNIAQWKNLGVKSLVTFCPHCFNNMKKDYASFGNIVQIRHYLEILPEILENIPRKKTDDVYDLPEIRAAYHDSCYLGRLNNLYELPREILSRISPNLELVVLAHERENALCCGGGGARIIMEEETSHRASRSKMDEVSENGIDLLVTSCPYCLSMFADAAGNASRPVKVKDLVEIVAENLLTHNECVTRENSCERSSRRQNH